MKIQGTETGRAIQTVDGAKRLQGKGRIVTCAKDAAFNTGRKQYIYAVIERVVSSRHRPSIRKVRYYFMDRLIAEGPAGKPLAVVTADGKIGRLEKM